MAPVPRKKPVPSRAETLRELEQQAMFEAIKRRFGDVVAETSKSDADIRRDLEAGLQTVKASAIQSAEAIARAESARLISGPISAAVTRNRPKRRSGKPAARRAWSSSRTRGSSS